MATIGRNVDYKLEIDWDFNGAYTDESVYLVRASGEYRITAPGSSILSPRGIIPQMNISLFNDGRFSPFNTGGALYAYISGGQSYHAPVKFSVSIDGGAYVIVFAGHLKTPIESGVTVDGIPTVSFDCRGVEERLQRRRISTTIAEFAGYYDDGKTEAELITAWLTAAGMTPGAGDIDYGLIIIPAAWMDDESPLEDIWQLAASAGGWAYSTRDGDMVYRNATYLSGGSAATETIDSDEFERLSLRYDDRELFNEIIVEASPRELQPDGVLWEPDELPVVMADSIDTITATLRQPAHDVSALTYDAVTHGGEDISADVSVVQTQYAQRIELEITNANTDYAVVLRNMQILGVGVSGGPTTEEKRTSVDAFWDAAKFRDDRSRTLRGNVYIQSRRQAAMLADMLIDWHEAPRPFATVSGVQGVPTRDLLDRITISDANVMTADMDIFVTSIRWTAGATGYKQDIEGIAADGFYPYADETEGYFILGTNKLGASGGTLTARLFY